MSFLQDDRATLSACSLTCHALTLVSQSFLLREMRLGSIMLARTKDELFRTLDSSPHLGLYVRILYISWDDRSGAGKMDALIFRLGKRLENVQLLRLKSLSPFPKRLGQPLARSFPNLRILEHCGPCHDSTFVGIFRHNPWIESLSMGRFIGDASTRLESTLRSNKCGRNPGLVEIYCASYYLTAFVRLKVSLAAVNVGSMDIAYSHDLNNVGLTNALMAFDGTLKSLKLRATKWENDEVIASDLSLASSTHLRTLELGDFRPRTGSVANTDVLFALLSSVVTSSLEEVTIHIDCQHVFDLKMIDWARLNRMSQECPFSKLREWTIYLEGSIYHDIDNAARRICDWLPDLRDRALLTIRARGCTRCLRTSKIISD